MKTKVIDLVDASMIGRTGLQKVVCKFVIISHKDCLYMIIGRLSEYGYHAKLVERFCKAFSVPFGWADRPSNVEVHDSETRIRGGGWAEIYLKTREIKLFGFSTAYGRFIRTDIDLIIDEHELLPEYSAFIED